MSVTTLRQCFFCDHLNPGGAGFCNDCGSPLHVRPCSRCGAIDKLTAKACHKCGEVFSLSGSLEIASPHTANTANEIRAESDNTGSPSAFTPTILEEQRALSELKAVDSTSERTPLPESAALMLSKTGQGVRPESKENPGKDVEAVVHQAVKRNDDPENISGRLLPPVEAVSTGKAPALTGSRLFWGVAVSVALLATIAFSVHYYRGQPAQLPENQQVNQLAPPPAVVATIAHPLPAREAEIKPLLEPPIIKQCPEAIETLGLCSPDTIQEK